MTEEIKGLPVAGYKPTQSVAAVALVNEIKEHEERSLRLLDRIKADSEIDPDGRWLQTGRTHIERGFSFVCRSVFKPGRFALPEDAGLTWRDRVTSEAAALRKNLSGLNGFLAVGSPGVSDEQAELLLEQQGHMSAYLDVLETRLAAAAQ